MAKPARRAVSRADAPGMGEAVPKSDRGARELGRGARAVASDQAVSPSQAIIVTVTKMPGKRGERDSVVCGWCRRPVTPTEGRGRPRRFCKRSCRQRDFEARQRSARHGVDENELIVARRDFDRLHDEIFVLACAVADAEADLRDAESSADLRLIITSLLAASRDVSALSDHFPTARRES